MPNKKAVESPLVDARIDDIQVLRGVAIVLVLLYHLSLSATFLDAFPIRITSPLYLGVDIFFVVSGFVITRSLMKDSFHAVRFFVKRVFRLMPALLLFIGVTLLLNRYVQQADLPTDAKSMLSVSNHEFRLQARAIALGYYTLVPHGGSFANGAMWSLSVEDQFYAAVAVVCLSLGFVFRRQPRAIGILLCLAATSLYLCLAGSRLVTLGRCVTSTSTVLAYLTNKRFDFLALGVSMAFFDSRLAPRIRARFAETGPFCAPFLLFLPLMLGAVCESPLSPPGYHLHSVGFATMGVCFGALVLLAANGLAFPQSKGWTYRLFKLVGNRSYTYYLFHFPMFIVAWLVFHRWFPFAFRGVWHYSVAQCLTVVALLIPLAEIVYRCVELPLAELGRKIAGRVKTAPSTTVPAPNKSALVEPEHEPLVAAQESQLTGQNLSPSSIIMRQRAA